MNPKYRLWDAGKEKMFDIVGYVRSDKTSIRYWFMENGIVKNFSTGLANVLLFLSTGIIDKNGKDEVFDGDIVEFCYEGTILQAEVKFEAGAFMLVFIGEHKGLDDGYAWLHDYVESWGSDFVFQGTIEGNIIKNKCPECEKINTVETTSKGYYPSDFRYCDCGYPFEV